MLPRLQKLQWCINLQEFIHLYYTINIYLSLSHEDGSKFEHLDGFQRCIKEEKDREKHLHLASKNNSHTKNGAIFENFIESFVSPNTLHIRKRFARYGHRAFSRFLQIRSGFRYRRGTELKRKWVGEVPESGSRCIWRRRDRRSRQVWGDTEFWQRFQLRQLRFEECRKLQPSSSSLVRLRDSTRRSEVSEKMCLEMRGKDWEMKAEEWC